MTAGVTITRTERRLDAYRALREAGYSQPAAAGVMHLSVRTAVRYEARLRTAGWVPPQHETRRQTRRQPVPTLARTLARLEDYCWLLGSGESRPAAAVRLGVSERTAARYDARLRGAA